jgi:hypothetical protein
VFRLEAFGAEPPRGNTQAIVLFSVDTILLPLSLGQLAEKPHVMKSSISV